MLGNRDGTNEKPWGLAVTKPQGTQSKKYLVSDNSTILKDSKSRYSYLPSQGHKKNSTYNPG